MVEAVKKADLFQKLPPGVQILVLRYLPLRQLLTLDQLCKKVHMKREAILRPVLYQWHSAYSGAGRTNDMIFFQDKELIQQVAWKDLVSLSCSPQRMWTQVKAHSASSQDYNQSIYMTLKDDGQTFWSSGGSPTPEASEWLLYELPKPERICDVHIRTYDHSQIQGNPENLYAPVKVQILVGDTPEHFTFVSKEFEYCRRSLNNQSFSLLPNFAVGRFVKVLLIGKPQRQVGFDDQYYLALAFVGATTQKVPEKLATVAENTI